MTSGAVINFFSGARLTWLLATGMLAGSLAFGGGTLCADVPRQWWSVLTYAFVHSNPMHLAVNLIALLVAATWCELRRGGWQMVEVFASGIVAGGALFMVYAAVADVSMWLEGASAGIISLAVCALLSYRKINAGVHHIQANTIALILLLVLAAGLVGPNPGGAVAHIGGWIAGCVSAAILNARSVARFDADAPAVAHRVRTSGYMSLTEAERIKMFNDTKSRRL